jgi:RES domain-containing protein
LYAAASEALAVPEVLVHLSSVAEIPVYKCVKASIPNNLSMDVREASGLPEDWNTAGSEGAKCLGTRWLTGRRSAVLSVPSVVVPREFN